MNLTLLGFSGTGKTSVSRLLAGKLEKKLVSTDEECEKKALMKVEKFVRKYGWIKFLELESEVIENISDFDDCVVDADSSIILRNENIINLKKNGLIILLTADQKTITSRIKKGLDGKDYTKANYIDKIRGAATEYEKKYRKAADYAIDTSNMSPGEVCDLIFHYMQMEMQ